MSAAFLAGPARRPCTPSRAVGRFSFLVLSLLLGLAPALGQSLSEHPPVRTLPGLARAAASFGAGLSVGDADGDGVDDLLLATPRAGFFASGGEITRYTSDFFALLGSQTGLGRDTAFSQSQSYSTNFVDPLPLLNTVALGTRGPTIVVVGAGGSYATQDGRGGSSSSSGGCFPDPSGDRNSSAIGDFDGDGMAELIVGCPFRGDFLMFSATLPPFPGLESVFGPRFQRGEPNIGAALAAGDFDGDGVDDLAVGSPRAEVDGVAEGGKVDVLFGRPGAFDEDTIRVATVTLRQEGGRLGTSLAAGDFNGDGYDDLVAGAPFADDEGDTVDSGVLFVYNGGDTLDTRLDQILAQDLFVSNGGNLRGMDGELFGLALAVGDFNGDDYDDLAVGVPYDSLLFRHGSVNIVYGDSSGLSLSSVQVLSCGEPDLGVPCVSGARWGSGLAVGDFNADGYDDLGIGAPGHPFSVPSASDEPPFGPIDSAGVVIAVYGSQAGLQTQGAQRIERATIVAKPKRIRTREDTDTLLVPMLFEGGPSLNDEDAFGRQMALVSFTQPVHGTATFVDTLLDYVDPLGNVVGEHLLGALLYAPPPDFVGLDTLTYVVAPVAGKRAAAPVPDSARAMLRIDVENVNDPPLFINVEGIRQAFVGRAFADTVFVDDPDPNELLRLSVLFQPEWLTFSFQQFDRQLRLGGTPGIEHVGFNQVNLSLSDAEVELLAAVNIIVELAAPLAPVPTEPPDGAVDVQLPVTLRWEAVPTASAYTVEIATDPNFERDVRGLIIEFFPELQGNRTTLGEAFGLQGGTEYFWRVQAENIAGVGPFSEPFSFTTAAVVANEQPHRHAFDLAAGYPNPFTDRTTITFSLARPGPARLTVYDVFGRVVRRLVDGNLAAGPHAVVFEAGRLAGGLYTYRLEAEGFRAARQMVVLR